MADTTAAVYRSPSQGNRMEEFTDWRRSATVLHKCILYLITILGFCLELEFANATALVAASSRAILMKLFVVDISVYFGSIGVMILQIDHSNTDFGKFMNKISVLLGTLASVLQLLILFPPFGWLALFFWGICCVTLAIKSYGYSKILCESAVAALVLAFGEFQVKLIAINGRLMGSSAVSGIRLAYGKLKDLIKRNSASTEQETKDQTRAPV